jgi:hypothetical protein
MSFMNWNLCSHDISYINEYKFYKLQNNVNVMDQFRARLEQATVLISNRKCKQQSAAMSVAVY